MTKRKIILGEYLEFEKGISVPRDRLSITNNIAYLHYGDIYKIYNHVVDIDKEIDNILKISTDEKYKKTQLLKDGDIVYNLTSESVDDLGKAVYIRNPNNIPFVSGMETTIMRVTDKSILLPEYLNYILSTYKFKCLLRQYVTGMKVYRVHPRDIGRIEIEVPDINEQKKIIDILNPFNDKIELNNQMNQTLEKIASLLYKRWFVDFEFPDDKGNPYKSSGGEMVDSELGMIPKGWEVKELGSFFDVITGKKNANVSEKNGRYRFFTCSRNFTYSDQFEFDTGAIILAGNGDFNVKWYRGKFDAYQRTYVLSPHNQILLDVLFWIIRERLFEITVASKGSVIKFITKGMIENFKIIFPKKSYSKFVIIFSCLNKINEQNTQNNELVENLKLEILKELC